MALTKQKGDVAELMVAADLRRRGYKVLVPFGEECDYDLVVDRDGTLERIQVKHVESDGRVINVWCRSNSLTSGKVRRIKRYTQATIDWLAIYDPTSDNCYYVPAGELGTGRDMLSLRLTAPRNGQRRNIRFADSYLALGNDPPQASLDL
jgi:PD-(D/E)XK endonuclease